MNSRNNSPFQYQQNNVQSHNAFTQHTPVPAFSHPISPFQNVAFQTAAVPQNHTAFPIVAPQPIPLPPKLPTVRASPLSSSSAHSSSHFSHSKFTLPSTKDIPLLSGKHDWGPWHSAVRTLVLNANLLGHIAEDPLPGTAYDPGLWPTYPPSVHQGSTQHELQAFSDWWSHDGLVSHILNSRVSPAVLGSLPIANERMGQRRSARNVYFTLRHQYGAGDYSAVMVIEARLRQLKCLPARGGVRVTDFITTWRVSYNQMEAAGFLPGTRQLLAIFADGLPNNTVSFVNLYDHIIFSLNEPNEQALPNIHGLFDRTIHIENNIQRSRIMNPPARTRLPTSNQPATPTTPSQSSINTASPVSSVPTTRHCKNCNRPGHTDDTCFQPGGGMEGRREEFLANRPVKPIAHITEVEEVAVQSEVEEVSSVIIEDNSLNNEFAAMSLSSSNNIEFSTYAFSTHLKKKTSIHRQT
jgi:hypothetical protein